MSERQAWRPPVAPKPTNAALIASGLAARDASPAQRGVTTAFKPPPRTTTSSQVSSAGAAVAAAAAGRARAQGPENNSNSNGHRVSPSPVRGRSQLSLDLDRAARTLEESAQREQHGLPHLHRAASEIAARAASANASPSRKPDEHVHGRLSPQNVVVGSREPSVSALGRSESNADAALLGATISMSPREVADLRGPLSNDSGKIDFSKIPSLVQASTPASAAQPLSSRASTFAARTASQGAQRRVHAPSLDASPPKVPPLPLKESPPARHLPTTYLSDETASRPVPKAMPIPIQTPHQRLRDHSGSIVERHTLRSSPKAALPIPISRHPRTSPHLGPSSLHSSPRDGGGGMDVSSLANAMVSASLASSRISSRAASPSKKKPPPVPRRRSQSLHDVQHRLKPENPPLKPMTVRPMKQTLRKHHHNEEDEDEKRGRKHRLRKHPNVHHEGDRKRWRDKLTIKERKRYEGLWAANRGILQDFESFDHHSKSVPLNDLVLNVVVRDIWDRSRLPRDTLEEIWDLVAEQEDRALNREQFVVGLWLIDQRLKGRKLPVKVSISVWSSVRHTQGVKVSNKPL